AKFEEGSADDVPVNDPFEPMNRKIFAFNKAVDDAYINPVVLGYREALPQPVRTGVSNVFRNLRSPIDFINQTLQGDFEGAGTVVARTVINTTVGIAGLMDVAEDQGLPYEQEDFGQTLASWGVGHGPYVVVPVLGPSSTRDYIGYFADAFMNPVRMYLFNTDREDVYYALAGAQYLELRESLYDVLADLENASIDYYASVRSTYYQRREALVQDSLSSLEDAESADIPVYDE
ncbi:MAG: VacJ family lipoprotein, partial [Alphaproteobacteria bacterium]|nr:VacJ family lipoprotein [Alphaproteobacteria bacterium]